MLSCQKCYANSITLFSSVDMFSKRIILWDLEKVNLLILAQQTNILCRNYKLIIYYYR